eukprot:s287_g37.t1
MWNCQISMKLSKRKMQSTTLAQSPFKGAVFTPPWALPRSSLPTEPQAPTAELNAKLQKPFPEALKFFVYTLQDWAILLSFLNRFRQSLCTFITNDVATQVDVGNGAVDLQSLGQGLGSLRTNVIAPQVDRVQR